MICLPPALTPSVFVTLGPPLIVKPLVFKVLSPAFTLVTVKSSLVATLIFLSVWVIWILLPASTVTLSPGLTGAWVVPFTSPALFDVVIVKPLFKCLMASSTVSLPVPPILVIVILPLESALFGANLALPPKILTVLCPIFPITSCVKYNWLPLIASVLVESMRPAPTLVMVRCIVPPTLTVAAGALPAKPLYLIPFTVASFVATTGAVVEPLPKATSPTLALAVAP